MEGLEPRLCGRHGLDALRDDHRPGQPQCLHHPSGRRPQVTAIDVAHNDVTTPRRRGRMHGRSPSETPAGPLTYGMLIATILVSAFPVYWMLVVASSTEDELANIPPSVVPKGHLGENFRAVFSADNVHFLKSLFNSAIVAVIVTASVLFFCSLAGFAFAKLRL